jgi:hypothetical protein
MNKLLTVVAFLAVCSAMISSHSLKAQGIIYGSASIYNSTGESFLWPISREATSQALMKGHLPTLD